jgi:hypothetical protein
MRNMYQHPAYVPHGIMKVIPFWEYRYPRTFIGVCLVGSFLAAVLGVILLAYAHQLGTAYYGWAVALFAVAALRVYIAYQLTQFVRS